MRHGTHPCSQPGDFRNLADDTPTQSLPFWFRSNLNQDCRGGAKSEGSLNRGANRCSDELSMVRVAPHGEARLAPSLADNFGGIGRVSLGASCSEPTVFRERLGCAVEGLSAPRARPLTPIVGHCGE